MFSIKCDGKTYSVEELIEIIREYERRKSRQNMEHENIPGKPKKNNA